MQDKIKAHLEATLTGEGVPAALRMLRHIFGMTGTDIAFALGRDRTMVSLYENGRKDMPAEVTERLADILKSCGKAAQATSTQSDVEDELLEYLQRRTEELIQSL